jgi:transposase
VHIEFGFVALAHNILKVAGLRQLLSVNDPKNTKAGGEKRLIFLHLLYFRDLSDSPFAFGIGIGCKRCTYLSLTCEQNWKTEKIIIKNKNDLFT